MPEENDDLALREEEPDRPGDGEASDQAADLSVDERLVRVAELLGLAGPTREEEGEHA